MPESAWKIPSDWDGENLTCVRLMWPDSDQWLRLLVSLLYTLTRGYEWDRDSGVIKDAQQVGWRIFDANVPINLCAGEGANGGQVALPTTIEYRGGSLIVIQEDDMGQVVTAVEYDAATQELIVYYGKCCPERISLAGLAGAVYDAGGEIVTEPLLPDVGELELPTELPEYTACGKADYLVTRLAAIGHAAWNNRTDPWSMASAIQSANPGYSVSMTAVTSLFVITTELTAVEALADTDIFNAEFLRDMKCWILQRTADGEAKGISQTEFVQLVVTFIDLYAFSEVLDLDVVGDLLVSQFWATLVQQVVGYNRLNQIMAEAIGYVGDCVDCGLPPVASQATDPDASGWYASAPVGPMEKIASDDAFWDVWGRRDVLAANAFGVIVTASYASDKATLKQMHYGDGEGDGDTAPQPEISMSGNLGGDYFNNIDPGAEITLIFVNDDTIAASLAAGLGLTASQWVRKSPHANIDAAGVSTTALKALLVGFRLDADFDMQGVSLVDVRYVHKVGA